MKLSPLGKNIIFMFLEDVSDGGFVPSSGGKIQLVRQNLDHNRTPKWGRVLLTGPQVPANDIKVGDYILIEPLMWTPGFEVDDLKCWKTDSDKVMIVSSEVPDISF
jgi:hypothetical protein